MQCISIDPIYLECKQYVDQWIKWKMDTFQNRKIYKKKDQIGLMRSTGGLSGVSRGTKYERLIQISFDMSWSFFKVCLGDSY